MVLPVIASVLRIDVIAMIVSFAVAAFLLFGCSGAESAPGGSERKSAAASGGPPGVDPPGARLIAGGVATEGGIGTRCWGDSCVDMVGPVTNIDPIALDANGSFTIELDQGTADELSVTMYDVDGATPAVLAGELAWPLDPGTAAPVGGASGSPNTIPAEPGLYVLSVFANWQGKGDVTYGWYIEVR